MSSYGSRIPAIRTFQFDASSVGDLRSSVNLFRGDVNYTQTLFSMPGRNADDGMSATVSLLYQSNVHRAVTAWNRDQPTSVIGVGWDMPVTCITLDGDGPPSAGRRAYSYTSGGARNPLVREPVNPFLFAMDGSLASELADGEPVPSTIRGRFASHGIAVGAAATMSRPPSGSDAWTVTDTDAQTQYLLVPADGVIEARDGGESYQLTNYKFWKFLYYPAFERWSVVNTSGQTMSFGGVAAPTDRGYATSFGNSIEWAVCWTSSGAALWTGASTQADGQRQYARAWRLARVSNIWGDAIAYGYNEWPRDTVTGLIPGVEQRVGNDGLPYTKACYPTSLTDVFGRKAVFVYGDKLWAPAAEDPREYADPHKATPDDAPNGYQDRYETRYLASIQVSDADGTALFGVRFLHQPRPEVDGPEAAVANVTSNAGTLKGDTFKRYLTGIAMTNADGRALPGIRFDYHLDPARQGASPGALRSITQPQGGTAGYSYTRQDLAVCERTREVAPPAGMSADATPRVWFGPDYAVSCWYDIGRGELSLVVHTWLGRWEAWQPATGSALLFSEAGGLDLQTLDVVARADFFALSFRTSDDLQVYVFRKAAAQPGQWVPATVGSTVTGFNAPTLRYDATQATVTLQGGDAFLVATSMDEIRSVYSYDRLTWRWTTDSWDKETETPSEYTFVAAFGEYYATLGADTGTVRIDWLDPTLTWRSGAAATLASGFPLQDMTSVAMSPGESLLAISHARIRSRDTVSCDLFLVQWDQSYDIAEIPSFSFSDRQEPSGTYTTSWVPAVIGNAMVAVAGHVLRFNGRQWLENSALASAVPQSRTQQRFAYGPDYVLKVVTGIGVPATVQVLSFDPNDDCAGWTRKPVTPAQALPSPQGAAAAANWPSSGQEDWFTLGQYLYFRGSATNWDEVLAQPPLQDLQALVGRSLGGDGHVLDTQSMIDEAPGFLAFAVTNLDDMNDNRAVAVVLKDGGVFGAPQDLKGERIASEAGGGAGTSPGGPAMFASFPDAAGSFETARTFFLHRYAGDAVSGSITHFAVTGLSIDDGFQDPSPTAYVPDPAKAACDPTGFVVKYFRSSVYPGTSDPAGPVNGSVENCYLNGLDIHTGENFYDMMDGLLYSVTSRDNSGNTLSQTTYDWAVCVTRSTDRAGAVRLAGGFVVQAGQTRVQDGVSSSQAFTYLPAGAEAPFFDQPVSVTSTVWNGAGTRETLTRTTTYGHQVDDVFVALNMLDAQVQTVATWTPEGGDPVAVSASATVYTGWPTALGADVLAPGAEGDFGWVGGAATAFPFADYVKGQLPTGWNLTKRVLARTPLGLVCESADGLGVVTSIKFGRGVFPVATFVNASRSSGQCAYWGFEPCEDEDGFSTSGTAIVTTDAHTGVACLAMPAGGSLSVTLTPAPGAATYVLGYWYKTPSGFRPSADDGWSIAVTSDGKAGAPISRTFDDTAGQWAYATVGIPLVPGARTVEVTATARVGSALSGTVLLDGVFAAPLGARLSAKTFDTGYHLVASTVDAGGLTNRTFYNRFQGSVAQVGSDGQTKELSLRFLSRQGNADDRFDPAAPNVDLTLHPAGGGVMESFRGPDWAERWDAGASAPQWTAGGGRLRHVGPASGTLAWRGWADGAPETAALFFEVLVEGTPAGSVSVGFGGRSIACAADGGWSFTGPGGTVVQRPLGEPPARAEQWLLILGRGVVLFFGDGQLLFSAPASGTPTDGITITTGPDTLELRHLTLVRDPRLGVSYSDATGRQRQIQQLATALDAAVSDAQVMEIVYDALDRQVAVTKSAPASFGKDAALPLMQYRPNFVDVARFLENADSSWEMSGDVADYYAGQVDGAVVRSDDRGYPYTGTRFEPSPLGRPLERGLPGRDGAIRDIADTTPAQRQTAQYSYGRNDGPGPLPAGNYTTRTITGPTKTAAVRVSDTAGRQVAATLADGPAASRTSGSLTYADDGKSACGTLTLMLPNAFTAGPQTNPSGYVSTVTQDALGRLVRRSDPSSALTRYIYDPLGRMRFAQPAMDAGQSLYFYYKYDALGRLIEEGSLAGDWDAAALQRRASVDPAWPDADDGAVASRVHRYDGDGNDPCLIGRKHAMTTLNPAPAVAEDAGALTVAETFAYDREGRVATAVMALSGAVSHSSTISYAYNNLNEVTSVAYPEGAPLARLIYRYDDQGRVVAIGSSADTPTDIAAYAYSADGAVETETRNAGTLATSFQYNSAGWLERQQVTVEGKAEPVFSLDLQYRPDSTPTGRTMAFAFEGAADSTQTSYTYDGQRRLVSAGVAGGKPGSESISSYDANGNIWQVEQDGATFQFSLEAGTDRLAVADLGGVAAAYAFTADGWMAQGGGLALERDPTLGVVTNVTVSGQPSRGVRFGYGGAGLRVLKQAEGSGSARLYIYGSGGEPLATVEGGVWTAYVYGPTGLVAVARDKRYFPLSDGIRTVWGFVDDANALAARYDYRPFGEVIAASGAAAGILGPIFSGQEYDAETGLYNFRARLYHPVLRRFVSPDPARQFASPYVFVGNDPLTMVDPSGGLSLWGRVGLGALMAAVTVAGVGLSLFTGGASDAAATALDATLAAGEAAEGASEVGAGVAAAAEGGEAAAGTATAAAGEGAAQATASSSTLASNLSYLATQGGYSAMSGGGWAGLKYDYSHGRDFSLGGFAKAIGIGAGLGFASGALVGLSTMPALTSGLANSGISKLGQAAAKVSIRELAGGVSNDVTKIVTNVTSGQSWNAGLASAFAAGFVQEFVVGVGAESATNAETLARLMGATDDQVRKFSSAMTAVKEGLTSDTAKIIYATSGATLLATYDVWGLTELNNRKSS